MNDLTQYEPIANCSIANQLEEIIETIANQIQGGLVPWDITWTNFNKLMVPQARHAASGKLYQGTNHIMLTKIASDNFYVSEDWGTPDEWSSLGEIVRAEEKPHIALRREYTSTYASGVLKAVPVMKAIDVFNRCQLLSYERPKYFHWQIPPTPFDRLPIIDKFVENTKAIFEYGKYSPNYSTPITVIRMPSVEMFITTDIANSQQNFYAVQLQQLAKWALYQSQGIEDTTTGKIHVNIASELCGALLCERFGLNTLDNNLHASFIGDITSTLSENEVDVLRCKNLAENAAHHLYSLQHN